MSFINVTLSTNRARGVVFVTTAEDIATFCPTTVTLSAVVTSGNPTGVPFIWEQVLKYQYTIPNFAQKQFVVAGNISASFYGFQELVEVLDQQQVVQRFRVQNVTYNGTNTVITVFDTIDPTIIPKIGVFQHSGSANDGSFTWDTARDTFNVVITPTVFSDKVFRFWSNRNNSAQFYNEIEVVLTPRDITSGAPMRIHEYNLVEDCSRPIAYTTMNPFTGTGQCGALAESVSNPQGLNWSAYWTAPTCRVGEIVGYVVQQSTNGGNTWTSTVAPGGIDSINVPAGTIFRVGAIARMTGFTFSATQPTYDLSSLFITWSNTAFAGTGSEVQYALQDTICFDASPLTEPITSFSVAGVVNLSVDESFELGAGQVIPVQPISGFVVTYLVQAFFEVPFEEQVPTIPGNVMVNPITAYTVSGSGTIGG